MTDPATTDPTTTDDATPEVLFVCIHNAGRSQMAAALLSYYAGDRIVVRSAGTAPGNAINPTVVAAMNEVGIDLHALGATPKSLTDAAVQASDVVITMGCGDECPYYPGTRYLPPDPRRHRPAHPRVDQRTRPRLPTARPRHRALARSGRSPMRSARPYVIQSALKKY